MRHAHHAIARHQLIDRGGQAHRGEKAQRVPRVGGRLPDGRRPPLQRLAADRAALVRRARGVALDHADARHRHVQLLGDDLRQGRRDPGAQLHLAGEERDLAVGRDRDPGVDLPGRDRLAGRRRLAGQHRLVLADARRLRAPVGRDRERHQERARRLEQRPPRDAGDRGVGGARAHETTPAACRIARRMRRCVPQRQRLPASAPRSSPSSGFGFEARSAAAVMIMPLMQKPHWAAWASMKACCSGWGCAGVPRPSSVVTAAGAHRGDRHAARAHRAAVHVHGARAALGEPAAEARAAEAQLVTQHVEQRRVGRRRHRVSLAVDRDLDAARLRRAWPGTRRS